MLENRKYVSKFIKILMGIFILMIALSTTSIASETIGAGNGTINPIYRPQWTKVESSLDTTNQRLIVKVKGSAYEPQTTNNGVTINYASNVTSTLAKEDITVYINGVEVTSTTNPIVQVNTGVESTSLTSGKKEITHDIILSNLEKATREAGVLYKDWSGNVSIKIAGRGQSSDTYNENVLKDDFGNQNMMETDQNGTNADGTWINVTFEDANTDRNTNGVMFADFIKPEFTYEYSETVIDKDNKILTVVFYAADKYLDGANSGIQLSDFYKPGTDAEATITTKPVFKVDGEAINIDVEGNSLTPETLQDGKVIKYTLVVKNLQKYEGTKLNNPNDGFSYSGNVSITIPANEFVDNSRNGNDGKTITVGIDDPTTGDGHNSAVIVDVVDPIWKTENIDIDFQNNKVTLDLVATDKYYSSNTITSDINKNILLYVDGALDGDTNGNNLLDEGETLTPNMGKTLSTATNLTPSGTGVRYTLTIDNWNADEYSGTTKIVIAGGTITDQHGNTSIEQEFLIGHIDFTKPVIELVSSTKNPSTKTETIVFTAKDKYMDTSDLVTIPDADNPTAPDEITVYIDGEVATGITRQLTSVPITESRNGSTVTIGHTYTLVLSGLEQTRTSINRTREFSDWSGTVQIEIAEGAVKDIRVENPNGEIAGGNINEETTLKGDFVDFIKPNVTYEYVSGNIDYTGKTFTMVFDITDKYFKESTLANEYEAATTDAEKLTILKKYLTIKVDNEDITNDPNVTMKITGIENVTAKMNKTVDNAIVTGQTHIIGKRFTLEISDLQQELVDVGDEYLDYSGVITVAVKGATAENTVTAASDTTGNTNNTTTITSGVNIPGGTGTGTVVDVVDPLWEISGTVEARPHDQYANLPIKGTDKYIVTNNLQPADITVIVTSPDGVVEVTGDQAPTKGMTVTVEEDTSVTLNYGKQYNVEVTGYTSDAYQVKLVFREGILVDQSNNVSQETSFVLFTSLVETSTETEPTSEFLSMHKEEGQTIPQRQYVEQVIFKDNLDGINETRWDVSQLNDGSIWAWYTTRTSGGKTLYTVYIGSYIIINGNVNSSYLFANLGKDANCKVTGDTTDNEFIENLYLLHVSSVTNMHRMFSGCGYANMKSLDLGSDFDTRLVTDMTSMFFECGYTSMVTVDLGDNFNTNSVTDMECMFYGCGYTAMTSLDLSSGTNVTNINQFNTSNVTDMDGMFQNCGYMAMSTLDLGTNFNTSNVTNMNRMFDRCGRKKITSLNLRDEFNTEKVTNMAFMFYNCGREEMISLDLGDNFDTSQVTNMQQMFNQCGREKMTSLDLGEKFYTTNATNMYAMFFGCGYTAMTTLDLGPAFTRIPDGNIETIDNGQQIAHANIFGSCGNSTTTIYAPESIYSDMKNFKLNTTSSTKITLDATTQGTINPVYRPEWTKVSSSINESTGTMTVTVKGAANKVGTPISQINYLSDVTSSISATDITVYVDGELAEGIVVSSVSEAEEKTNATTGKKEVEHTITLTSFEEDARIGGKNFKEWSGNVSLQFAKGTLKDMYGGSFDGEGNFINTPANSNLAVIDIDTAGTTQNIVVEEATKLNANTDATEANMFGDFIKPEFTYEYANTVIGNGNNGDTKTVKVVFDVTDKYFSNTDLATDTNAELITVLVDGVLPGDTNRDGTIGTGETLAITKALTKTAILVMNKETKAITTKATDYTIPATEQKVGERYELLISDLQQNPNDSFDFSGTVTLGFGSRIVEDLSGNENDGATITIGINETDGNQEAGDSGSQVVVDVVDPIWRVQNLTTTTTGGITTATMDLIATDKFFKETTLEKDDIQVIVAGVNIAATDADGNLTVAPELQRNLSTPVYIKWDNTTGTYVETTQEEANGQKYTFTVSCLEETYAAFIAKRAEYIANPATGRLYREYSGPTSIVIPADTIEDESGNKNIDFTINMGHIDTLKPEIIKVSSQANINATNVELSTHTIVFDIVDKYLDTSSITTEDTSMIHVYLDGELTEVDTNGDGVVDTDTVTKTITKIEQLNASVNGTTRKVGYRYTLELSSFENARTAIDYDREYTDWSGDLTIKIDANIAYDVNPTNSSDRRGNAETILAGNEGNTTNTSHADFVDYIKPDATYEHADTDVDYDEEDGKTYTMTFDITDKFFETEDVNANGVLDEGEDTNSNGEIDDGDNLSISDITILMSAENETESGEDGYYDLTSNTKVGKSLRAVDITNTVNGQTEVIGKRYTLVLTNLEHAQRIEGNYYLDYSGSITIAIPKDKVKDSSGNGNDPTSITSGINIPGGEITDIEAIDVIAPLWERTEFTTDIHNKTATIKLLGTDKYFFNYEKDGDLTSTTDDGYGTLTNNEIKLFVNGTETTGTIAISGENRLYEERLVQTEYGDGDVDSGATTETVQYGIEYTITITNFTIEANQVKIRLIEGSLIDKSNNESRTTEFLVYNTLIATNTETEATSKFLNEIVPEGRTAIARQDIEQVVFVNSIEGSTADGVQNVWDVSAQRDSSILAWYSETERPYTVYIGSNDDIYGNKDSSYLFSYIGYSESCAKADTIKFLNLLRTENVTDMGYMFNNCGYDAMTSLTLPNTFDTSNVTDMKYMFNSCGYTAMTSLTLPNTFDTSKVTGMRDMFNSCGYKAMISLTLPESFDTSNVTNMFQMFHDCGWTAMTSLDIGDNFDTRNVTDMQAMFEGCGYTAMTSLDLSSGTASTNTAQFNTSSVLDMDGMFYECGYTAMTNLNLGKNFDTSKVTSMWQMFYDCGFIAMTSLDLSSGIDATNTKQFNTSKVTNMEGMFAGCGYTAMTSLNLGNNFDTSEVTTMRLMFNVCGRESLTSLDLGDKFDTTKVTNMYWMFTACGKNAMTTLDLGPAFTHIPDGTVQEGSVDSEGNFVPAGAHERFIYNTGKEGECTIYAPESIYNDMKHFKLNTDSETTIEYTNGTINPKYKPEWIKFSSSLTIEEAENLEDSTMTIIVDAKVDETVYADAIKTITYALTAGNDSSNVMNVLVDGENAETITQTVTINTRTEDLVDGNLTYKTNGDIYATINGTSQLIGKQYKIVLSNFEEEFRQTAKGKNFKEWAGNVALRFTKGSLMDAYGNKNMVQIDVNPADLTVKEPIQIADDTQLSANVATDKMFADFIKPEFSYEYSETIIGSGPTGDKKVKVVFDVTDKYFNSTTLSADQYAELITVQVASGTLVGDLDKDGVIDRGEDVNLNGRLDEGEDLNGNGELDSGEDIRKTLTKTAIFVMNKETKAISSKPTDYTIPATEQKVGERYELLVEGLENIDGVGYSGPMTFAFPAGVVNDLSGNESIAKSITIGIDDPANHPEHDEEVIVDVVNPIWTGPHDVNTIDRTADTVSVTIIGSDKYYASNSLSVGEDLDNDGVLDEGEDINGNGVLDANNITVYVDNTVQSSITKTLTKITDVTQLATLASNAGLPNNVELVGYILTLGNFGDQPANISGTTKIVIDAGTIVDDSTNENLATTIFVGNEDWEELNEPLEPTDDDYPRYPAFRQDIVDFIDPAINYTYSTIEGSENPDVDYERKTVTVKFTVSDKYLLASDLIGDSYTVQEEGVEVTKYKPKNMSILIDSVDRTSQVTTSITADSTDLTDGEIVYTLVVSNIEQTPNNAFDFSGPMQLVFSADAIEDKSGNKNTLKAITLDTEIGEDIVDVVDPIIMLAEDNKLSYRNTENSINRNEETVTVIIRGTDKYFSSGKLLTEEFINQMKVKVTKHDGTVIDDITTYGVTKTVTNLEITTTTIDYKIVLDYSAVENVEEVEGITSLIIPANTILDTSGNGNLETEVFVGKSDDTTAFKDSIVDFTEPTWNYATSSITRDRNDVMNDATDYVTVKIIGHDNFYASNSLTKEVIEVYINGTKNDDVQKDLQPITDETELTTLATQAGLGSKIAGRTITDVVCGYTLTLSKFGTNEGEVYISIPVNKIIDTSDNVNEVTDIDVGNADWIETDVETDEENPKYTAFRGDIVDYIKPVIKYQYSANTNPLLDKTDEDVEIVFTATDTNFLESEIGLEDIKVYIDDMQVYGTGVNENVDISAAIRSEAITDGSANGLKYTLTLSALELNQYLENEVFERHSGVIKVTVAGAQVADTSGNKNNETTFIVDKGDGDDQANGVIVDFVNPNIYYKSKYINWQEREAYITLRVTDRFYDSTSTLIPTDLTLYELNDEGQYVQINDFNGKIEISRAEVRQYGNLVGYDYTIKLKDFEEEFKMKINVAAGKVKDTSNNYNDSTDIFVDLDNRRPAWKYVSTDTTNFESQGKISYTVKGVDKFLNITNSNLDVADLKVILDGEVYLDGTVAEDAAKITVNYLGANEEEKSKSYKIDITGLTDIGTYSLVFAKDTLVDEFNNKSAATTISFSKSTITTNTGNYINVTYHVTPDLENVHSSYIHELMSVNTTGTNFENTTYRPSTLGELHNDGENPLFAEPMYNIVVTDGIPSEVYAPKSFAGWAEADGAGNPIYYTNATLTTVSTTPTSYMKIFGLYDEIPNTIVNLKAIWQDAKVVFVSNTGDNANDGKLPSTPVQDLETAYGLLNTSGDATNNIIVIMNAIEFDDTTTLNGSATITSLYAGVDYRATNNAELKLSSNMTVNGTIIFDNIELYTDSTTVSDGTNYLGNGTYTNMLISNYSGNITLGRRVTTPAGKYTLGAIVGGNYKTETSTGNLGTHTIRVEAGKYNNIIAGSTLASSTQTAKYASYQVVIGNMKDAAVSRNDKLTITGYVSIGENEKATYPEGSTGPDNAYNKSYSDVTLYSGTFTGTNKFKKSSEDALIYLRSINGESDGLVEFEMFGGNVLGNVYGGARTSTRYPTYIFNDMKFYGGQVTGNIFGRGATDTFTGSTNITLQGRINITGNVFGGSNATAENTGSGSGNTTITINSASVVVNGNIYGGSNGVSDSGYVTGRGTGTTTAITLSGGKVTNIYGSGNNSGNSGITTITIENGQVTGNVFGGAHNSQGTLDTAISVLGGIIDGNIYGGNDNTAESYLTNDTTTQDVTITIGDTDVTKAPTINGNIYGSGKYDRVHAVTIDLIEATNTTSVFGGSDSNAITEYANIVLNGMTVNEIYGGGDEAGTVRTANINLMAGTATEVYGGGYKASATTTNIKLEGTATVTSIYGGSNASGTVTTSNVTLTSGNLTNVFGGGNSAGVGTSNVTLDGITIDTIYGGSKDAGVTTQANVTLTSGTVNNVFGGGLDVGATETVVVQAGATVTNIYGGNNSTEAGTGGETGTTNIEINNATVENIYGGNYLKGTTQNSYITIHGDSTITGKLYGGGYRTNIGTAENPGSTSINIAKGTIQGDINGGSEQGIVYGTTNINIGIEAIDSNAETMNPVTSDTAGNINILGTIYGAGSTETAGTTTVVGNTNITLDNSTLSPITYYTADGKEKTIYGSGKGGAIYSGTVDEEGIVTDNSKIYIKDFGTSSNIYEFVSIERTGNLYIGNSTIELVGNKDTVNGNYYTLNRITNALSIYNNTTLYTQRGFNMVGGYNSYSTITSYGAGTKANVSISGTEVTKNVNNRLYTLEGVNLIFAKKEVTLANKATLNQADWGEVSGMTFFGMYKNTTTGKQYDIYAPEFDYSTGTSQSLFRAGTYVEGQYNASHAIQVDGFYTNVVDEATSAIKPQVITTIDYTNYCDWIINAPTINYDVNLIASTYGKQSIAELLLNYKYANDYTYKAETIYTLNQVSTNALKPDVVLVDPTNPTKLPTISTNANNTFGLTMETTNSGWLNQASTTIYTTGNGTFGGDTVYKSDTQATAGSIRFKIHNSLNITEQRDLGNVNIILTGQQPIGEGGAEAYTFKVVIAVNLQSIVEELNEQYTPSFTDRTETELSYTTDSRVDLSYLLYKDYETTPYTTGSYRVLSTTTQLPAGTTIKIKDYGQGDTVNKVYYYHVTGAATEYEVENGRYLYKLANFKDVGSTDDTYADIESNIPYYNTTGKYALEKYDVSIDFRASNISADKLAQETYLELRNSDKSVKYDNGDTLIKYNLYSNKNAVATETISNEGSSYSVVETLEIPLNISASLKEQTGIMDTKYYDQIAGIAVQIVGESGVRIKTPELQNFKITNTETGAIYEADATGVIRMPLIEGCGQESSNYKLSITQSNVSPGRYKAQVRFYTADDGKYYGTVPAVEKTFNITFISKLQGLVGVEATDDSRIIYKSTGLNLVENSTADKAVDMTVSIGSPTNETNIRVELYKRNPTYTNLEDETTYTGTSYTLVDIAQYLQGTWTKPDAYSLTAANAYEYVISPKKTYETEVELETMEFEKAVIEGIATGEYKLVFKAYSDDTLVQTIKKTFVVIP